jgi:malonyl-CoA/methylmalonyl-CoA synthetase
VLLVKIFNILLLYLVQSEDL